MSALTSHPRRLGTQTVARASRLVGQAMAVAALGTTMGIAEQPPIRVERLADAPIITPRDAPQHRREHSRAFVDSSSGLGPEAAWEVLPVFCGSQGQLYPAGVFPRVARSLAGPSTGQSADREVVFSEQAAAGRRGRTRENSGPALADVREPQASALDRQGVHGASHRVSGCARRRRESAHRDVFPRAWRGSARKRAGSRFRRTGSTSTRIQRFWAGRTCGCSGTTA